jgi:hypothetical protein
VSDPTPEELAEINRLREEELQLLEQRATALKEELQLLRDAHATETGRYNQAQNLAEQQRLSVELARADVEFLERKKKLNGSITAEEQRRLDTAKETTKEFEKQENVLRRARDIGKDMASSMALYGRHSAINTANLVKLGKGLQAPIEFLKGLSAGAFTSIIDTIINLGFQVDKMESDFMKATGASKAMAGEVTSLYESTRQFGVETGEAAAATEALMTSFTDFTMLSQSTRAEVLQTTAILGEFGVASGDVAKGMQISTKAFGLSAQGAARTSREITALAQDLGVPVKQLHGDFASVGGELAKMGNNGTQAFKDLAMRAKATGLEIGKLLHMTSKFDTFEGAAEQAGKLNAALGGNMVNAMDLLTETDPAARFDMIRDAILDTGLSFDDMSYYQRKFYADAAGLENVSDLAGMLSGDYDGLTGDIGKTSAEIADQKKQAAAMQDAMTELKNALLPLIPIFTGIADKLSNLAVWIQENMSWLKPFVYVLGGLKLALVVLGPVISLIGGLFTVFGTAGVSAGVGGTAASVGIGAASGAANAAIPVMLAFGAAVLQVGLGVGLAAAGIGLMAAGMSQLFVVMDWEQVQQFVGLLVAIGTFGYSGAGIAAGVGFAAMGAGFAGMAVGLWLISGKKLASIATFTESIASIEAGQLGEVADTIERIAAAMDQMPEFAFSRLGSVMTSAATAATALAAMNRTGTATARAPWAPGAAQGSSTTSKDKYEVEIKVNNDIFETKVLNIVDGKLTELGLL